MRRILKLHLISAGKNSSLMSDVCLRHRVRDNSLWPRINPGERTIHHNFQNSKRLNREIVPNSKGQTL